MCSWESVRLRREALDALREIAALYTAQLETASPAARDAAAAGGQLLALWATPGDTPAMSATERAALLLEGRLLLLGMQASAAGRYPGLQETFPAASRMQRAAFDLTGVSSDDPDARPWLRHNAWPAHAHPLRECLAAVTQEPSTADDYPFVRVDGEGVHEIPVGPVHAGIIEPGAAEFVRGQVDDAVRAGARLLVDPRSFENDRPGSPYLGPAVLIGVDHSMRVMTEESIGPVIGIQRVTSDDEAVRLMNDSAYGLTAAVWTRDEAAALAAQDDFDVTRYFLDLDFNPSTRVVSGSVTVTLRSLVPSLGHVVLDLLDNMTVSTVQLGGVSLAFTRGSNLLDITLNTPLSNGQTAELVVSYSGSPQSTGLGSFGWNKYIWGGQGQMAWSLSEPDGARSWWPCKDRPDYPERPVNEVNEIPAR